MEPVSFRYEVTYEDLATVRAMVERTGFFRADEVDVAVELVAERLARGPSSGYEFVFVEQRQRAVAYASYGQIACTLGSYDLYWIVVAPDSQRTGLGSRLLKEVERLISSRAGRHIYIETSGKSQYVPTRSFYERNGYELVACLPEFYDRGDDKIIFRKVLS